jgi:hypothetical protein
MSHSATTEAIKAPDQTPRLRGIPFRLGQSSLTPDRPTTQLREARDLQRLIYVDCQRESIKPSDLAALARAWAVLQESIRVLRGIPSPGQLRPDLDPVQLKRAMKRARGRQPIEIAQMVNAAAGAAMMDAEEEQPASDGAEEGKAITKSELDTPPDAPLQQMKTPRAKPPTRKASKPAKATDGEKPKESL